MKKQKNKKILVLQGPNINLIGIKSSYDREKNNLSQINRYFKKIANTVNIDLAIFQTNEESRAINIIQKSRNKINGIIIIPGPWQKSAHCLSDTLDILRIPFVTISTGEKALVLQGKENYNNTNFKKNIESAIKYYYKL